MSIVDLPHPCEDYENPTEDISVILNLCEASTNLTVDISINLEPTEASEDPCDDIPVILHLCDDRSSIVKAM